MTKEELSVAVKREQEERLRACAAALTEVLDAHGCELVPVPGLSVDGRIVAQVELRAK